MNRERKGKRLTAFLLAALMMISTVFCTEIPVSAYSFKNTIAKSRITTTVVSSGSYSIKIKWDKSRLANNYAIYRKTGNQPFKRIKTVNKHTFSYIDKNLVSGTQYEYAVRGLRKEGGGKEVLSKYKTVAAVTRPARMKLGSISAKADSSNQVTVSWKKAGRADGYQIYRKASGQKWRLLADVSPDTVKYVDKKASANTKYVYTIRAYKKLGNQKLLADYREGKKVIESNLVQTPPTECPKFNSAQKEVMKKILYAVETGGQIYGNQDYADFTQAYTNSGAEHAITIGAGQWYATEAQRLLKLIHTKSPATWKKYDKDNAVWKDVCNQNWNTYKLSKNHYKAKRIINIIKSPAGIKCQDQLMYEQINEMEAEIRKLGITEPKSVGMFINIRHQGGYGAVTRVLRKTKRPVNLDNIFAALKTDTGNQVGTYRTRQNKVYTWLNKYM